MSITSILSVYITMYFIVSISELLFKVTDDAAWGKYVIVDRCTGTSFYKVVL